MKRLRKLGSILTALALCLAFLPVTVWAAEEGLEDPPEPDAGGYSVEVRLADGETEVELNDGEATIQVTATITAPGQSPGSVYLLLSKTSGTDAKGINYQEGNSATRTYNIGRDKISLSFSDDRTASITFTITFGVAGTRDFLFSVLDEDDRTLASKSLEIIVKTPQAPLTEMYIGGTQLNVESGGYYVVSEGQTVETVDAKPGGPYARLYQDAENDSAWTLELNNFTYSGAGHTGLDSRFKAFSAALYAAGDLTIVLTGTNRLTCTEAGSESTNAGVYVDGALTFTGAGSLTAIGADVTDEYAISCGIYTYGSITMAGTGTVAGTGGDSSGDSSYSYGVWAAGGSGSITVGSGSLTGTGGSGTTSGGVYANESIEVKGGGSLEGTAGAASASGGNWGPSSVGVDAVHQITVQDRGVLIGTGWAADAGESSAESTGVHGFGITVRDNGVLTGTAEAAENNSVRSSATSMGVTAGDLGITVQDNGTLTGRAGPAVNYTTELNDYLFTTAYAANSFGVDSGGTFTIQGSGVLTGGGGSAECSADSSRARSYGLSVFLAKEATPPAMALEGGRTTASGYTSALDLAMNDFHEGKPLLTIAESFDYAWRTAAGGSYNRGGYTYDEAAAYTYLEILPASQAVIPVTGVTLSENTLTLTVGGTGTLTATVSPGNATNRAVTWTSSDTAVATVSNGVVTAVSPGTATITARSGGKTASCTVNVTPPAEEEPDPTPPGDGSGSSGGSSGGGSSSRPSQPEPAEPPVDVTTGDTTQNGQTAAETTARPPAAVERGAASASVSDAMGREIVQQVQENGSTSVVIAPEITGDVSSTRVSLPASTVSALGTETTASLTVSTPVASVTIPNGGLTGLATEGGDVTVSARVTGNRVTLEVASGGERVEAVTGGVTLTVPAEDTTPGTVAVLIQADGTREVIRKSVAGERTVTIPLRGSATVEIVDNSGSFDDVSADSWYSGAVAFVSGHELFSGTGGAVFAPDESMTRGMLAQVLHNLESNPAAGSRTAFRDVAADDWYAQAVAWAASEGIVSGYGNGAFGPGDPVTREQLAVMLYRYAQHEGYDTTQGGMAIREYADYDQISDFAREALDWAVSAGIINGTSATTLSPSGSATRAQVAVILMRFCQDN